MNSIICNGRVYWAIHIRQQTSSTVYVRTFKRGDWNAGQNLVDVNVENKSSNARVWCRKIYFQGAKSKLKVSL
jgi:hypothetical protein